MIRRIPIFSTLLVLAAVGVMIALGFWQLDRRAQKEALLAPMIEGKKQFAFAWLERQSRYNLADVSLKATKEGNGWSLSGHKGVVYNAALRTNAAAVLRMLRTRLPEHIPIIGVGGILTGADWDGPVPGQS